MTDDTAKAFYLSLVREGGRLAVTASERQVVSWTSLVPESLGANSLIPGGALTYHLFENTTWYCAPALFGTSYWDWLFKWICQFVQAVVAVFLWLVGHTYALVRFLSGRVTGLRLRRHPIARATIELEPESPAVFMEPGAFCLVARREGGARVWGEVLACSATGTEYIVYTLAADTLGFGWSCIHPTAGNVCSVEGHSDRRRPSRSVRADSANWLCKPPAFDTL